MPREPQPTYIDFLEYEQYKLYQYVIETLGAFDTKTLTEFCEKMAKERGFPPEPNIFDDEKRCY